MRQNICNICGANYEYRDGKWRCPACGAYKPEEVSGEEETLLYSAAQKLRLSAFDDAEEMYRDIVAQYPKNSRGYWGLVLAKYGIKYEKDCDGKTVKMIPSCYAASYERILDDENYKKALQYADKDNRAFYEEQAKRIEDVRRRWVEIAEREEPCDIFISYKDSDMENGIERTQDSYDAYELYNKLKEKGYRVFYSRESLAGKEGEKFEPYIFNALNTAQVMIVYGTKPEYIESTWVKNEWMRYYKRVRSGQKQENSLVLAYKGFNPSELPTPLCDIQGIDLGRITIGFGDLEAKVSEIISAARMRQKIARVSVKGREKRTAEHILRINTVEVGKVVSATSKGEREHIATRAIGGRSVKLSVSAEKSLKVAENYLERGQFAEAEDRFDEILQSDPHNGRSLTGKLLAQARAETMAVFERQGLGGRFDSAFIEKVLSYAERETAENVLGVLCAEASRSIEQGNSVLARQFISLVRDYDNASVNALREEIYEHGLRLIASDGEFAKYCLDTNLLFEADEVRYSQKLHTIVDIGIKRGNFAFAEYYADKLKEVDENSYSTQIALLEIEYSVSDDVEVFRHLEQSKDYAKIESVLSELDALSAEKWLRMCFVQITELLQKELFGGALRWIEVCAKYEFEGRKSLLESLLDICMKKASIRSADCFEAVLTYVADGESSVYATKANYFADAALKAKEFDAAKQYYGKVLSVSPGSVAAAQGVFFADICCASDKDLPSAIVRLTDWTSFEEVLVVQTDDADDLKWIEKLADACMEDIRREGQSVNENVFSVFEKLLSYIPEVSDSVLLHLLRQAAELCLKEGLFAQAQKFYEMFISVDAEDSAIYWGLLQAKLKCHNEEELVRQPQLIGQFAEFENAQVCAADEKKVLEHYIDIRDRQSKHIKSAKKRKRFIKIGSIMLAAVAVVVAALVGWLTYYDSQNQLLYHVGENGYTISAGKFYETESSLTIPAEWNGDPVVAIGSDAFSGHEEIEEVVLPASIETIGANAFADCVNLKSVVFITDASARTIAPQTALREIGDGAFSGCKNLETFDLPYGIERIGARAFAGTDLHEATIPNTVNHVGSSAFDGCNRLQTIIVGDREEIPTEWAGNWQDGCDAMVEFRLRVIFEYNGAMAGNTINEQYVLYGGEFHFPVPERKGYAFYGWFRGDTRLTDDRGNSLADWQYKDGGTVTAEWVPNVNRIVFDANGGSGDMQEQGVATDETVILSANTFTRSGYTFAGWAESATGSVIYEDGAEYIMGAESSYKLFAVWTANSNEILFDGNGATGGSMENQFMATDSSASLTKNAFVKTGYQFVGWSTSTDGGAIYADQAIYTMGTEARYTLYAVWETVDYTIRYYLNNGIAGDNPSSYTIESEDIILKAATRAGYRFTGWTGTGLSAPTLSVTIHMGSTGNREYTATWEANTNQVIFNANGGKGEMPAQSIRTDETVPLSSNLFTREGYAFVGWAEAQSGGSEYSDGANYTMGAESEYTLYAVWRAIEYTISYTLNGGNVSGNPDNYTIESDTFRIGNPVRAGYTFTGWTGTGLEEPMLVVTVVQGSTGNREYTATWQANLNKIIFHANGGDGVMSAQEIGTDASAQLSACTFMRPGYTFIGWATSENGAAVYEDGDTYIMGTEPEYDLYAAWELIEYSIQYMLNGGTALGNPEMFTVITPEFTLNAPVRDGYTFTGWSGTGIDGFSMAVTIPTGSMENREYTANWEANENKVIFHANGGSGEMQPQTIKTDVSAALSENAFVYSGYTFTGWATEPEGDIAFEDGAEYFMGTAAEYHLYAVWTPNLNSIIFDGNGADSGEMAVQTGYTDSEVALTLNSYQRRGYRFLGWATEKDGAVVYADGERIVVGHETAMTLYAKWEALSYKVTLASVENNIAEEHVTFGSEYSFLVPERRGYMFGGWYSAPGGGGTKYADEEGKGIGVWSYDGDITLYSYWLGTDGLAYILNESGTYTLTGLTDTDLTEVYIPEYFDGKPVTEIAENAFAGGGKITEILVPASISVIGKGAFAGCTALQSLTIPFVGSARDAEGEAALLGRLFSDTQMSGCTLVYQYYSEYGMTAAYIPDSLTEVIVTDAETIGYGAFSSVTTLQRVSITANILGARAFYDCVSLAEVELRAGMTAIGQSAFARCVALQKVVIPASVQTVGRYVFDECAALTSLTLPFVGATAQASGAEGALGYLFGSVTSADMALVNQSNAGVQAYFPAQLTDLTITNATQLSTGALQGLAMLKNISWNDGITAIGNYALYGCTGLTAIKLPASLQTVGNYAFYNVRLSVLELPQSVVSIGTYALYGSGLRTLLVPSASLVSLGSNALDNAHTALKIYVTDSLLSSYKSSWSAYASRIYSFNCIRENGMAIDGSAFLQYFGDEAEIALPANVTSIGAYAFAGTNVRSVLVPGNIRTIGANAFSGCDTLETVRMLSGVRTISANAFYGASGLKEVEIPNTVTSIGASAFYGCSSLTEVVVPNSVTSIGQGAFQGCNSLVKMTLPFVGENRTATAYNAVFGYIFGYTTSTGGSSSRNSSTSFVNTQYGNITGAIWQYTCKNELDHIQNNISYYNYTSYYYYIPSSLREVVITNAEKLSSAAFNGCTMLTSITLNEGITAINGYAFQNCDGLTEITIPESVTSVGIYAFAESGNLAKVTLPGGLTAIADYTFQNCTSLASLNGNGEVVVGANVTSIGGQAFTNCSQITSFTMQGVVTRIGAQAFDGCLNLIRINSEVDGKIVLQEGLTSVGNYAFRNLGKITEVVIPNSVTSIGTGAFQGCNSLIRMTLPFVGRSRTATAYDAVFGYIFGYTTYISSDSFRGSEISTSFVNMKYGSVVNAVWQYSCGNVYSHSSSSGGVNTWRYYKRTSYWYYIPSSLREVVITDADKISNAAFNGCTMLTSIALNEGITAINGYAFQNCENVSEFIIPESVTSIGTYTFAECTLLQTVQILREDVLSLTSLGASAFGSTPATLLILVPDDAYSAYIAAANWSTYADKIRPASACEDGFIVENGVLLHYIGTAETVTIPAGVTSISRIVAMSFCEPRSWV